MAVDPEAYLGTGWAYPIQVDSRTQGIKTASGEDSVRNSIRVIIGTSIGSRIMNRRFGSTAKDTVFDPANDDTVNSLVADIERAIIRFEPRVQSVSVSGARSGPQIDITVRYRLIITNTQGNLVYPYYIEEQS